MRPAGSLAWVASLFLAALPAACGPAQDPQAYDSETPTAPLTQERPKPAPPSTKMIFGGRQVAPGKLLNIVGLTRPGEWTPSCTGTLIQPDIVLSAAHCFCNAHPTNGDTYVGDDASVSGGKYYKIAKVKLLAQCPFDKGKDIDIAVVRLIGPVKQAQPMALAATAAVDRARKYRVAGFGAIDVRAMTYPWEKREAVIPKVSADCQGSENGQSDAERFGCLAGAEIVAGQIGFPDTCSGDSGGPLLVTASGEPGAPSASNLLLAGVTSRAVSNAPEPCGHGGVYVRLTSGVRQRISQAIATLRQ